MKTLIVLAALLLCGCAADRVEVEELRPGRFVAHVSVGVLVPAHPQEMDKALKVPKEEERLEAIKALRPMVLMDAWIIPGPSFRWMMVQLTELRRLQAEGK